MGYFVYSGATTSSNNTASGYITAQAQIVVNATSPVTAAGSFGRNGAAEKMGNLYRIVMPDFVYSEGDVVITSVKLYQYVTAATATATVNIAYYKLLNTQWVEAEVDYNNYKTGGAWSGTNFGVADYDTATNLGLGNNGKIFEAPIGGLVVGDWHASDLTALGLDWGKTYNIVAWTASATTNHIIDFVQRIDSPTQYTPWLEITYLNKDPEPYTLTAVPSDDGLNAIVTAKPGGDKDIQSLITAWDTSSAVAHDDNDTTITDIAADTYRTDDANVFAANILANENQNYFIRFFAQDDENLAANATGSNTVLVKRPSINTGATSIDDTSPDIGQTVTLTITAGGGLFANKVKKFYVNWDSAVSDKDEDYGVYTLEDPAASNAITHVYSTSDAKVIKYQVEDEVGWRSNRTALASQPTVAALDPIAIVTTSRSKALAATYGDRNTSVIVSGQQSKAIGSNRTLINYWFTQAAPLGTTIVTANTLNQDNSVFDEYSKRVAIVSTSSENLAETEFKVFGLASFDGDGDAIRDDAPLFSHYKYASSTFTASATQMAQSSASSNYFKTVECVICTDTDPQDTGDRFVLQAHSGDDTSTPNINTELRVIGNSTATNLSIKYRWGGLSRVHGAAGSGSRADFYAQADSTANLAEPLDTTETDILVTADSVFATNDVILIDTELMLVTDGNLAGQQIEVTRGYCGTTAASHDNATDIYDAAYVVLDGVNTTYSSSNDTDWYSQGFFDGDVIKVGNTTNNGTYAAWKYFKIRGIGAIGSDYTVLAIETLTANLSVAEQSYVTTTFTTEADVVGDFWRHDNAGRPSISASMFNTASLSDAVTFHHGIMDDGLVKTDEVTTSVRFSQPRTVDLDTLVDNGDITIANTQQSRTGGLAASMPLGERRYPIGVVRARLGLPTLTCKIHILTQAGYRQMYSMVEGDTYDFIFLDSRKLDNPSLPYRSLRMKLESANLVREAALGNQYVADCNFIVVGEDIT